MQFTELGGGFFCFLINVDRQFVTARKNADALDMIAMFMGDNNCVQLFGNQAP